MVKQKYEVRRGGLQKGFSRELTREQSFLSSPIIMDGRHPSQGDGLGTNSVAMKSSPNLGTVGARAIGTSLSDEFAAEEGEHGTKNFGLGAEEVEHGKEIQELGADEDGHGTEIWGLDVEEVEHGTGNSGLGAEPKCTESSGGAGSSTGAINPLSGPQGVGVMGSLEGFGSGSTSSLVMNSIGSEGTGDLREGGAVHPLVVSGLGKKRARRAQSITPMIITVDEGEDLASKLLQLFEKGPFPMVVVTANGFVTGPTLYREPFHDKEIKYDGDYCILKLSASSHNRSVNDIRSKGLAVYLAGPDGKVIGGIASGLLVAASPICVVIGILSLVA